MCHTINWASDSGAVGARASGPGKRATHEPEHSDVSRWVPELNLPPSQVRRETVHYMTVLATRAPSEPAYKATEGGKIQRQKRMVVVYDCNDMSSCLGDLGRIMNSRIAWAM